MKRLGIALGLLAAVVLAALLLQGRPHGTSKRPSALPPEAREEATTSEAPHEARLQGSAEGTRDHSPGLQDSAPESSAAASHLSGLVLDAEGSPVDGVPLELVPLEQVDRGGGTVAFRYLDQDKKAATSDAEGRFEFESVDAGSLHVLRAQPPHGFLPESMSLPPGTDSVVVRLRTAVQVTLEVVDWKGAPVEGARVHVDPSGGQQAQAAETDANGRVELASLDPEDVHQTLKVRPPAGAVDRGFPWVDEDWAPRDQLIRLERVYTVTGVVVDRSGVPVPHAMVWLLNAPDESGRRSAKGFGADAQGSFRVLPLRDGDVELVATVESAFGGAFKRRPTRIRAGNQGVRLVVAVGSELVVTVRGRPSGEKASGRLIREGDESDTHLIAIDDDDVLRFSGLQASMSYVLWIPFERAYVLRSDVRTSDSPLQVDVIEGGSIRGRIRVPEGANLTHVLLRQDPVEKWAKVDYAEGTFRCDGLPPGPWTLQLRALSGSKRGSATLDARTGDEVDAEPEWKWEE